MASPVPHVYDRARIRNSWVVLAWMSAGGRARGGFGRGWPAGIVAAGTKRQITGRHESENKVGLMRWIAWLGTAVLWIGCAKVADVAGPGDAGSDVARVEDRVPSAPLDAGDSVSPEAS